MISIWLETIPYFVRCLEFNRQKEFWLESILQKDTQDFCTFEEESVCPMFPSCWLRFLVWFLCGVCAHQYRVYPGGVNGSLFSYLLLLDGCGKWWWHSMSSIRQKWSPITQNTYDDKKYRQHIAIITYLSSHFVWDAHHRCFSKKILHQKIETFLDILKHALLFNSFFP